MVAKERRLAMSHVLALAGSARAGSFNQKLLALACARLSERNLETEIVDLRDLDLPIYDGDLDALEGQPPGVDRLRGLIVQADGLLIAAPEYNHSLAPLLKNAIDWVSSPIDQQPFKGKAIAIMSAAALPWGGTRMLPHLRSALVELGGVVIPSMVAIPVADKAFGGDGRLLDAELTTLLDQALIEFASEIRLRRASSGTGGSSPDARSAS